jgi:hypothetical protein
MTAETAYPPRSVPIVGWLTFFAAAVLAASTLFGLFWNPSVEQYLLLQKSFPAEFQSLLDSLISLARYGWYWNWYLLVFFLFLLYASLRFVRFTSPGRKLFEAACWVGLGTGVVDALISYALWNRTQESMHQLIAPYGVNADGLQQLGTLSIAASLLLWIVPCVGLLVYLRTMSTTHLTP